MGKYKIFVDGSSGTTGLRIADRLAERPEFTILPISEADRKDVHVRAAVINESDLSFLCLPDDAAREVVPLLRPDDLLFITADHGCDPSTPSTDHSREHVPMLAYGAKVKPGVNIGTRSTYADLAATVAEYLGVKAEIAGESFLKEILK